MAPKKVQPVVQSKNKIRKRQITKTARSGLVLPVGRIQRRLREGRYAPRIGTGAAVYMAGVLEYLSSEILELSSDAARANKRVRINPRHIMMAVKRDTELVELLKDVTFPSAGVVPCIHPLLVPKTSRRKSGQQTKQSDQEVDDEQMESEQSDENVGQGNDGEDEEEDVASETSVEL